MNEATARQLGMATGAYWEDGVAFSGTAHAVGYDVNLAYGLASLHSGDRRRQDQAPLAGEAAARKDEIFNEFGAAINKELEEAGIAVAGLRLSARRLDMILPHSVSRSTMDILADCLPRILGSGLEHGRLSVWRHNDNGAFTEVGPHAPVSTHPLSRSHTGSLNESVALHQVETAAITETNSVAEALTYRPHVHEASAGGGPGFVQTRLIHTAVTHKINLRVVPSDSEPAVRILELQERERGLLAALEGEEAPELHSEQAEELTHALVSTRMSLAVASRKLDPRSDPAWRARLS